MRKNLFLFILLLSQTAFCQEKASLPYTDIATVSFADSIADKMQFVFVNRGVSVPDQFQTLPFVFSKVPRVRVRPEMVSQKIISRFNIANSTDSAKTVYFFPGFFFDKIQLYRTHGNLLEKIPFDLPKVPDSIGYRGVTLAGHDSATIYAEIQPLKTYVNVYRPRLINNDYLPSYIDILHHSQLGLDKWTYVFSGLLLMMILFSLSNYIQGGSREFLYYSGYAFMLAAMLSAKSYYYQTTSEASYFLESYLDFIMQSLGIACYMIFMQKFLETKRKYPFIHKLYNFGIAMLTISIVIYSYLHFFTLNYWLENFVENATKVLLLAMIVIFVSYSIKKWGDVLLRFLIWGNLFLFVFSLFSQAFIFFKFKLALPDIFNMAIFYYEIGLFLELVFFLMGLNYKNRKQLIEQTKERERLKLEMERKEFEKQMAVMAAQQEERNRISTDMHDELGSGMTAIRLMSEIAKNKMKENTPPEIERISQSADDVLNKMNAIIWSMNSKNDSLGNLISYIRSYALEYLDGTSIVCKVYIPGNIPEIEITGDKRRNLFLCFKETLNNMLKHAKASEVMIDISTDESLMIKIWDNGVGIDLKNIRQFGNGLQNISRRMQIIGGSFTIQNDNGTVTTLILPL
jgi:signal transduction histidine kinase